MRRTDISVPLPLLPIVEYRRNARPQDARGRSTMAGSCQIRSGTASLSDSESNQSVTDQSGSSSRLTVNSAVARSKSTDDFQVKEQGPLILITHSYHQIYDHHSPMDGLVIPSHFSRE